MSIAMTVLSLLLAVSLLHCGEPSAGGGGAGGASTRCPGEGYIACTSDEGCPCGLVCARLTSSTTERYCTASCASDDDCARSTRWTFSSVGCNPRTSVCIPTSP